MSFLIDALAELDRIRTEELEPVLSTEALRIHILSFLVLEEAWAWRRETKTKTK